MNTLISCPECGSTLPAGSPEGLCPKCLLGGVIGTGGTPITQPFASPPGGFVPPSSAELDARFPQFEILELLGHGGMGAVYKARQPSLDRLVALKILPAEIAGDPSFADRFNREAKALGRLNHPHIVSVHDFGQSGGLFYVVMEYVDGVNLREAIRDKRLEPQQALAIIGQICDALQFAHDEGIVHRDIKPENILLDKRGRVKIADFGLAKLVAGSSHDHILTGTHQVLGTIRYMAPEQLEGSRHVDHRADIYSLGVVFYEILTGEVPMGRFPPPSKKAEVDARLDDVVLRTLEREPAERYQQASQVKSDVEAISSGAAVPPADSQRREPQHQWRPSSVTLGSRIAPRDGVDWMLMLLAMPLVVGLYLVLPSLASYLLIEAMGAPEDKAIAMAVVFAIGLFLLALFAFALGSIHSATFGQRGIVLHRYGGPSLLVPWGDITGIREVARSEVLWKQTVWPGFPPRGSIMGMSAKDHYRIDSYHGYWYFCPRDVDEFLEAVQRYSAEQPVVVQSLDEEHQRSPLPPKPALVSPLDSPAPRSSRWGWAIVGLMVGTLLVLPCCCVGLAASFWVVVPVQRSANPEVVSKAPEAAGEGATPVENLFTQSRRGDLLWVRAAIARGEDPNQKDTAGHTALINAAIGGNTLIIKELLDAGAFVDDRNNKNETALMHAAKHGHLAATKRLIDGGANVNAQDGNNSSALDWAVAFDRDAVIDLLLQSKAERTGPYCLAEGHRKRLAGEHASALPLLEEAIKSPHRPKEPWVYQLGEWRYEVKHPLLFSHALAYASAREAGEAEQAGQHFEKIKEMKGTGDVELCDRIWLSPQARGTLSYDHGNVIRQTYRMTQETLSTEKYGGAPLVLRYSEKTVTTHGDGRVRGETTSNSSGAAEGVP